LSVWTTQRTPQKVFHGGEFCKSHLHTESPVLLLFSSCIKNDITLLDRLDKGEQGASAMDGIRSQYRAMQVHLQRAWQPKLAFKPSDCNTFSNLVQGVNGTCFIAAAINVLINSAVLMEQLEHNRHTNTVASDLWDVLRDIRYSGGGLPSILGTVTATPTATPSDHQNRISRWLDALKQKTLATFKPRPWQTTVLHPHSETPVKIKKYLSK
jgi:hypothetical protein